MLSMSPHAGQFGVFSIIWRHSIFRGLLATSGCTAAVCVASQGIKEKTAQQLTTPYPALNAHLITVYST